MPSIISGSIVERFATPAGGVILCLIGLVELLGGLLPEHVRHGIALLGVGLAATGIFAKVKAGEGRVVTREAELDVRAGETSIVPSIRKESAAIRMGEVELEP